GQPLQGDAVGEDDRPGLPLAGGRGRAEQVLLAQQHAGRMVQRQDAELRGEHLVQLVERVCTPNMPWYASRHGRTCHCCPPHVDLGRANCRRDETTTRGWNSSPAADSGGPQSPLICGAVPTADRWTVTCGPATRSRSIDHTDTGV